MSGLPGFYFCAVVLIIGFFISLRIARSPFGTMLKGIKSNQTRMSYTGINTRPYLIWAFVISGMYAGLAGAIGPFLGAAIIKYFENIFSAFNEQTITEIFSFLPSAIQGVTVDVVGLFVGKGWHLTLGLLFMIIVIFLPGGIMEGVRRIGALFTRKNKNTPSSGAVANH